MEKSGLAVMHCELTNHKSTRSHPAKEKITLDIAAKIARVNSGHCMPAAKLYNKAAFQYQMPKPSNM